MVVDDGRESNEERAWCVVVEDYGMWSSSGTGQDRQGEWEGGHGDDDMSESDETLSLSYHDKDTAAHHGEMLRARTTRQLVSLHACTQ